MLSQRAFRDKLIDRVECSEHLAVDIWEEGNSVFADAGSLLLYDFYVRTSDPEGLISDLDALCQNYVETEEDYSFDYEEEEHRDDYIVHISNFDLTIDEPEGFLEALDALCEDYAIDEDYDYCIEAEASAEADEDEEYSDEKEYGDEEEYSDEEKDEGEESYDEEEYCDEENE